MFFRDKPIPDVQNMATKKGHYPVRPYVSIMTTFYTMSSNDLPNVD